MAGRNAAERIIDVIELLIDFPEGIALSEISRRLMLPKSASHRLLDTLVKGGFVERPPASEDYRLSLKLPALGFRYVSQMSRPDICQPVIDRLAADTGELIRMTMADASGLSWVSKAQGSRFGLRYDPDMGSPVVLHSTASGRAWLATLPPEEAHALVLARGFDVPDRFGRGRQTVKSLDDLEAELERTRRRGYGLTVEEVEQGTAALAMAIDAGPNKRSPGTVSVMGPLTRMSPLAVEKIVPVLAAAVRELGELWPIVELRRSSAQAAYEATSGPG